MPMPLTLTSYAILGQLALRPWTAYDLAAQMRNNVHFFFPRAESQVYSEPKRLVEMGLATAEVTAKGRRATTTFSITAAGSKVLRDWLRTPVLKGPTLEFEALLRVMLGPIGEPEDLLVTLKGVRADLTGFRDLADEISIRYQKGEMPFQRHVVYRALMHDFLFTFAEMVDQWAERSIDMVEAWPELTPDEREKRALALIVAKRRQRPPQA